jgi:hypothetical protein
MSTAPLHLHGWNYTREGYGAAGIVGITYTDHKLFAFEVGEDVRVVKKDSPFYGMVGRVKDRRNGKPHKYHVIIPTGAPVPIYPFSEGDLQPYRALPVPMWITEGRWIDRVMVYGHTFAADDPIAARLMKRQAAERKRNAPVDKICLGKVSQSTAHERVLPLIKAWVRKQNIQQIRAKLLERKLWEQKSFSSKEKVA